MPKRRHKSKQPQRKAARNQFAGKGRGKQTGFVHPPRVQYRIRARNPPLPPRTFAELVLEARNTALIISLAFKVYDDLIAPRLKDVLAGSPIAETGEARENL